MDLTNYTKEAVKIMPKTAEAAITDVKVANAVDIFGDKAKNKEQKLLVLTVQNADLKITHEENLNHFEAGEVPDNSKLGKFLLKYGTLAVGSIVKLEKNEKGFWRIAIE